MALDPDIVFARGAELNEAVGPLLEGSMSDDDVMALCTKVQTNAPNP